MDRRIFLRGASALPLTLPASLAFAQTTKVAIGYPTSSDFLPALVAKEKGFFEKQGIDAVMTRVPLINNIPAAMMSGDLQIGAATPPTFLQAVDGGLDLLLIASAARHRGISRERRRPVALLRRGHVPWPHDTNASMESRVAF